MNLPASLFTALPADSASLYALECCLSAATMAGGKPQQAIAAQCRSRLSALRPRMSEDDARLAGLPGLSPGADLGRLTTAELVALHASAKAYADLRSKKKLEIFTRAPQWRIVDELIRRDSAAPVPRLLLAAECLEAQSRAAHLGLPYRMGDRPEPFDSAAYPDDASLVRYIRQLSRRHTYVARETLISIADHIQASIIDPRTAAAHITLLTAILSTGMPSFSYPKIVRALEKATAALARTPATTRMQLAPAYHILWTLTLKPSYLNHFQQTLRHCYHTLANAKTYPGLGVDPSDPLSLSAARQFLADHLQSLWILDPRYTLDKISV